MINKSNECKQICRLITLFFFSILSFSQNKKATDKFERIRNLDTIYVQFDKNKTNHLRRYSTDNNNNFSSIEYYLKLSYDKNILFCYNSNVYNDSINKIRVDSKKKLKKYKENSIDISFFKDFFKDKACVNYMNAEKDFLWKKIYVIDFSESDDNNLYMFPVEFCIHTY